MLAQRFLQKGYEKDSISNEIERFGALDRQSIITGTQSWNDAMNDEYRMILDYSVQYRKLERIVARHWAIFNQDCVLVPLLPKHPQFIYRKAPTLRNYIAPGVADLC